MEGGKLDDEGSLSIFQSRNCEATLLQPANMRLVQLSTPSRSPSFSPGSPSSRTNVVSTRNLISSLLLAGLCFHAGSFTATSALNDQNIFLQSELATLQQNYDIIKFQLSKAEKNLDDMKKEKALPVQTKVETVPIERKEEITNKHSHSYSHQPRFSADIPFMGMAKTSKADFVKVFDYGTPVEDLHGSDVLLLYNDRSIPIDLTYEEKEHIVSSGGNGNSGSGSGGKRSKHVQFLDTEKATSNCEIVHVATIPLNEKSKRSCLAIVQNYSNQFLQKWMRKDNYMTQPFQAATRGQTENSRIFFPPNASQIDKHWKMLKNYLNTVDDVLEDLRPVAKSVARDNTIIVLTCNMGQSELLMNFVCNARAKGLDVSNVLVFPTDVETKELAEGLGLTTFHDHRNFGELPKAEAKHYGDRVFTAMMFAKVLCVQLINHLGYDLLFQDVDVIWYKNPLDYFHDKSNPYYDFDMYFQDDGAHSHRYAPYSANSGFYYVRNNDKTKYLFTSLLYHNDYINQSKSHQQALIQLLADHASLYGLRTKVLDRDMKEFPGGWHYHRRKNLLKDIMREKVVPEIFHMSWTQNKDDKLKYYQQMGEWYLDSKCIGETVDRILGDVDRTNENKGDSIEGKVIVEPCCLAKPNIVCHYRDKPSKIPCKHVDPIDEGRPSFW